MKIGKTDLAGIQQYIETLKFTEQELRARVEIYLSKAPQLLYRGDIVGKDTRNSTRKNGYYASDTKNLFAEIISTMIIEKGLPISKDEKCTYNIGKRENNIKTKKENYPTFYDWDKYALNELETAYSETKLIHCLMMQGNVGDYTMVDYQIPTTNGKKENIDLLIRKNNTDIFYMIEAKTFGSNESILRCVLEIETYYKKLNKNFYKKYIIQDTQLKKGILIDKNSFAFEQLKTEWAKKLINHFNMTIFILGKDNDEYTIEQWQG